MSVDNLIHSIILIKHTTTILSNKKFYSQIICCIARQCGHCDALVILMFAKNFEESEKNRSDERKFEKLKKFGKTEFICLEKRRDTLMVCISQADGDE